MAAIASPPNENLDDFLRKVTGVIHGANLGQERETYRRYGVKVLWIEPLPDVYDVLKENISKFGDKQRACCALITDRDDVEYAMNVANNTGASSSIFDLEAHAELFPDIKYDYVRPLKSVTLPTLLRRENIDVNLYQALVLDVEGAEALVLKGASSILRNFRFVKAEAADFEARKGNATLQELQAIMQDAGFRERIGRPFSAFADRYFWDVVWERKTGFDKFLDLLPRGTRISQDVSGSDKIGEDGWVATGH